MKIIFKLTLLLSVLCLAMFSYTFKGFAANNDVIEQEIVYENRTIEDNTDVSWNLGGTHAIIDLNGQEFENVQISINTGTLEIIDSSASKNGSISGKGSVPTLSVGNNATLILTAGTLKGNVISSNGAAVKVSSGGTFIMNDGSLIDNKANSGGAVFVSAGASFTMNGGTISGNQAKNGAAVFLESKNSTSIATFTMNGGTISNNKTDYITSSSTLAIINLGGAVYVGEGASFNMTNGTITSNTASLGGAIYLASSSTLNISSGKISNNKSVLGGALFAHSNSTTTIDNIEISDNTAKDGGGIYLNDGSTFTFNNGTIYKNIASNHGGGLYLFNSNATANGGIISANTAENKGSGAYIEAESATYTFKISGTFEISGNSKDNAYLYNKARFSVGQNRKYEGELHVSSSNTPGIGKDVEIIDLTKINSSVINNKIISDNENYIVVTENNKTYLRYSHYHKTENNRYNTYLSQENISTYLENDHYLLPAGSYFIISDIIVDKPIHITGKVSICLNGNMLYNSSNSNSLFKINNNTINSASLTINDCNNKTNHFYNFEISTNTYTFIENNQPITQSNTKIMGGLLSQVNGNYPLIEVNNGSLIFEAGTIFGINSTSNIIETTAEDISTKSSITISGGEISNNISGESLINITSYSEIMITGGIIANNTSVNNTITVDGIAKLTGGEIKNNQADKGAGLLASANSTIKIGGNIAIYDNTDNSNNLSNIYLDDSIIVFISEFTGKFGVYSTPGQVTNNYYLYSSKKNQNITSDITNLDFELNDEGEYCLLNKNVIFNFSIENWIYNDTPNTPVASATYGIDTITYTYSSNNVDFNSVIPTTAGQYVLKAYIPSTNQYTSAEKTYIFNIIPKTIVRPEIPSVIYNGTTQAAQVPTSDFYIVNTPLDYIIAGAHQIELQLVDPENYQWDTNSPENVTVPFVINKKVVEIEWGETLFTYDGTNKGPNPTVKPSSLCDTNECILTVTGHKISVGTYLATITAISNPNYELPTNVNKSFTIQKASNEITLNVENWTYGETPKTPQANSKFGIIDIRYGITQDNISSPDVPKNAGTYYVKARVIAHDNYDAPEIIKSFTINPIELTYSVSNQTIAYGDTYKEISYSLISGAPISNDNVIVTATKTGNMDVGVYSITLKSNNSNYKIIYNNATYTITKAQASIIFNPSEWEYGYEQILDIKYNFGTISYSYYDNSLKQWVNGIPTNAGTYEMKAEIASTGNYDGTSQISVVEINKREIELKINNKEIFYGNADAPLDYSLINGSIKPGDNLNIQIFREQGSDVGQYAINLISNNPNYKITCPAGTYSIKKANTTITEFKISDWTYESTPSTPSVNSNYGRDNITIYYSLDNETFTTTFPNNAGKYYAKAVIEDTKNYTAATREITFNIFQKDVTVYIDSLTSVYNQKIKRLTYTTSTETLNDLELIITKEEGNEAGTYKITGSYNGNPNYNVKFIQGTYTITKAANRISNLAINNWVYGETNSTPTADAVYGDIKYLYSATLNGTYYEEVPTEAGDYFVMAYVPESKNYKYVENKLHFKINKATYDTSSFTLNDKTVKYDGTAKSIVLEGNIPETLTLKYSNNNQVNSGEYNVILQFIVDNNHEPIQSMMAKLTILKDTLYTDNNVSVNSVDGSNPNAKVEVVEKTEFNLKDYKKFLFKNNRISKIYDISFILNENIVQPDGNMVFKFLLPELLYNQDFEIIHIHNNEAIQMEYEIIDGYIVFTTNQMSEFIIAYKETSLIWLVVLLSMFIIAAIGLGIFLGFLSFGNINLISYFKEKNSTNNNIKNLETIESEQTEKLKEDEENIETIDQNQDSSSNENETTSTEIKLNSFILPAILPILIILNNSHVKAVIILSIILGIFLLSCLGIFIYKQFFKHKVDSYYENKRLLEEKRLRPYSYTVYNQDNGHNNSNNMEFILHPDFRTRKFDSDVDTDPDDEENVIEEISTYQNGRLVKLTINRSFKARLCQSNDDLQEVYSIVKNQLLAYKELTSVINWSYDNILLNDKPVAKFTLRGKYLTLYLALDPKKFDGQAYNFKDVSNVKKFETVPMKIRFILDKNIDDALELIDIMCNDLKLDKKDTIIEADYSLPYRTTDALIESEDIKIVSVADEFGNPFVNVVQQPVYTTQVVNVPVQMKEIYNRSFLSKLIQSDKNIKNAFALIKNRFNSYEGVESKLSWDHDSIYYGDELLGIITIKSKTLYFYIALEPVDYMNTDYVFKDASDDEKYSYTPMMIKVKNTKRVNQSLELIDLLAKQYSLSPSNAEPIEYNFPYQTDEELIKDELIQVINLDNDYDDDYDDDVDFESEVLYNDDEAAHEYDEMTTLIDGKVYIITYNRSFTAKFIQSSPEVQDIYQTLKNKFLSYPLKSRVSWAYDSFSYQNKNIARFTIKGKSLYLYLAIDPNTIDHNDYQFKDASSVKRYANTPVMIKLKTKKSVEQAKKLIDILCKNLSLKASSIPEVDYHQHYLSQEELINAGLIKKIQIETESSKDDDVTLSKFIRSKISVSEAKSEMSDEEAQQQLVDTYVEVPRILTLKKVVINIDTLDINFDNGDIVDLASLQQKNLISKNVTHIKILARGELSKKLIVIADQFSLDAVKMISLMGGKALKKNQIVKES